MLGDEHHRHEDSKQLVSIQSNKAHAVAILTPHIRRAPFFFGETSPVLDSQLRFPPNTRYDQGNATLTVNDLMIAAYVAHL